MGKNLLKAGYEVVVHNRSQSPVEELVKYGASAAASPEDLARSCEVVILSLPTSQDVWSVALGERGLVHGLSPGNIVIDTSTTDPELTFRVSSELKKLGCYFLDAPVSGGPEGAESASLTVMVGGESSAFSRCKQLLQRIGKSIFYLGESGSGQKIKLVNQALVGVYFLAAAEAYLWSKKMGIKNQDLLNVISLSWGDSPVFRHFLSIADSGKFTDGASLRLLRKDLSIILANAQKEEVSMPLVELAQEYFSKASALGFDNYDASAVLLALEKTESSR
jgi:3-hydroxyisobutyrate dehydrogenase-like beta-hydroxyacid dehydrogenase